MLSNDNLIDKHYPELKDILDTYHISKIEHLMLLAQNEEIRDIRDKLKHKKHK